MGFLKSVVGGGEAVGAREADSLVRAGGLLLDVREPDEWRAGHAPGARHIPSLKSVRSPCASERSRRPS